MVKVLKEKILLKPKDIKPSSRKFEVLGVLNPAAVRMKDGKILLYVRVIERLKNFSDSKYFYSPRFVGKDKFKIKLDKFSKRSVVDSSDVDFSFKNETKRLTFISHLRRVILDEKGMKILSMSNKPNFYGLKDDAELGVEDPRIVNLGDNYVMSYVGLTRKEGISSNIAISKDLKKWKRLGIIFGQQDKDVVLFPNKVKGKYVAFDRPEGNFRFSPPHIWIAYSPDLIHWGGLKSIDLSLKNKDFGRCGAGPPPIKTDKGWLLIFHAVTTVHPKGFLHSVKKALGMEVSEGTALYVAWAALFDKDNPKKMIARSVHPVLLPGKKDVSFEDKKVVFPTGIVMDKNEKDILLFCGSGDNSVSVKKLRLKHILDTLEYC